MEIRERVIGKTLASIRWISIAGYEIRSDGYSIVTDPCVEANVNVPYGEEVIDHCDLMLLTHGHWDHTTGLRDVWDRFQCPLLCGELTAPAIAKMTDIYPSDIYPMTPGLELDFGPAKVKALFGRHVRHQRGYSVMASAPTTRPDAELPNSFECNFLGSLEYRNWLVTLKNGLKVMIWGNNVRNEQLEIIKEIQPDVGIFQFSVQRPDDLAKMCAAGHVKVLFPHHMDLKRTEAEYLPLLAELDRAMQELSPETIVVTPEHLKWYDVGFTVAAK